jgi:cytidyltransferase-like protein
MRPLVITSGYFDPLHVGHVEYLRKASELGFLLVIVNSDHQAVLKKGRAFMPEAERLEIIRALRFVKPKDVYLSIDKDGSVCETIKMIHASYDPDDTFLFCKGGDRFASEIPEKQICDELGIKMVDGLGQKIQSSSLLTGIRQISLYPKICK